MWIKYRYRKWVNVLAIENVGRFTVGPIKMCNGQYHSDKFELTADHRTIPDVEFRLAEGTEEYCMKLLNGIMAMIDDVVEGPLTFIIPDPLEVVGESAKP